MRLRSKIMITASLLAVPASALVMAPAHAMSGPCTVTLGNPGPTVNPPTVTVDINRGDVHFKAGHVDTGNPAPRVQCFNGLVNL
jgi:hypothetical protein